jgi:hypothetical protein
MLRRSGAAVIDLEQKTRPRGRVFRFGTIGSQHPEAPHA